MLSHVNIYYKISMSETKLLDSEPLTVRHNQLSEVSLGNGGWKRLSMRRIQSYSIMCRSQFSWDIQKMWRGEAGSSNLLSDGRRSFSLLLVLSIHLRVDVIPVNLYLRTTAMTIMITSLIALMSPGNGHFGSFRWLGDTDNTATHRQRM